ncbi:MAG: CDP-alcohol phosphatidyltransferase family protein [Planctomycetota bacterium]|nr:CDP-alcohol phosphatidyltransferase family protein [Planctomycetota bacterium]
MSSQAHWPARASIPNLLTMLRAAMAVGFFVILEFYRFPDTGVVIANIAVLLFILAAATDVLDGHLARKWKVTSSFGRIMDPLCDKLLILGAFVYLAGPRFAIPDHEATPAPFEMATGVYTWMVVVIFARELFVTTVRAVAEGSGVAFGAKQLGKVKMVFQSIAVPVILVLAVDLPATVHPWSGWACAVIAWTTVAVTLASGVPYLKGMAHVQAATDNKTAQGHGNNQ